MITRLGRYTLLLETKPSIIGSAAIVGKTEGEGPLAEEFEILEPFGNANPKPLFATKNVVFRFGRKMGKQGTFAKYTVTQEGKTYELVFFGGLDIFHAYLDGKFGEGASGRLYEKECEFPLSVTYRIGLNSFRGKTELQLLMENYQ